MTLKYEGLYSRSSPGVQPLLCAVTRSNIVSYKMTRSMIGV